MFSKSEIKRIKKLQQKKFRDEEKSFLAEGWKILEEAVVSVDQIEILLSLRGMQLTRLQKKIYDQAAIKSAATAELSPEEIGRISETVNNQGIIAVLKKKVHAWSDISLMLSRKEKSLIIVLDHISEPGNLGTMIRTADWFNADAVVLSEGCVELHNPKVIRSTMGSLFHLPIVEHLDLKQVLSGCRECGCISFGAVVDDGEDVRSVSFPQKTILIIGNEANGIDPSLALHIDRTVSIPKFGKADSLNAGIAAGILIAHYCLSDGSRIMKKTEEADE